MFALTIATFFLAALFLIKGTLILWKDKKFTDLTYKTLYAPLPGIIAWTFALVWTLWEVTKLGPADFGTFKVALFIAFLILGVSSYWMLKDYLLVRGAAVLTLLVSWWLLKAAYLQHPWTRLIFVAIVYAIIIGALYLAVAPWRVRDVIVAMQKHKKLRRTAGIVYAVLGVVLVIIALTYSVV